MKKTKLLEMILLSLIIITFVVWALLPVIYVVEGSFKTRDQNEAIPPLLLFIPNFDAWGRALAVIGDPLKSSLIVASSSVAIAFVLGLPAAYALSRLNIKRKRDLLIWILSSRMAPPFGAIIPLYILMKMLNILDTYGSVIMIYLVFNLAFIIWILKGFIDDLPLAIEESALIDGCSRLGVLMRITIPLIAPGIVVTLTLCFIFSWNEFLFANILLSSATLRTLPPVVAGQVTYMNIDWEKMCALSTVAMVPVIALSLAVRRYLVRGLTLGALKG